MSAHPLPQFETVVTDVTPVADDIVVLTLARPDGADLPVWQPGAHIDLVLQPGLERQYSLCSDPADRSSWCVAVLREPGGRGGSEFVHTSVAVGSELTVRGPLNHFAFQSAPAYLFVAGGIGITPLLPMISAAEAAEAEWSLVYAGRSHGSMAFAAELVQRYPGRVTLFASEAGERFALDELFAEVTATSAPGTQATQVYCCGPGRLLDAALGLTAALPFGALHVERFEAKASGEPVFADAFEVELMLTGVTVTVPPERSILEVADEAGALVAFSCREGTCGTCETPVIEGAIDHRDSVLTPGEQEAGDTMMICVSRAAGPRLVLEL
ncbi:PDR/VanB family oxidoreductase [Subtercola sp. YIM 133946]|uniref:PDR/VanB family oxidoreductase n=1 Tax=Subtercola sp. YIM 133946 TaxID=3118909 RepID=UPI002F95C9C1